MSEKDFQTKFLKDLRKKYPRAWIYKTHDLCTSGVPDVLMLNEGRFFAFELKTKNGVKSKIQAATLKKIVKAGGLGMFIVERKNYRGCKVASDKPGLSVVRQGTSSTFTTGACHDIPVDST